MSTKITYNGKTTELADGYIATLPCKDLKMETDVVVEAPEPAEISDSPLPIEVSTEAEMTALLESGEIGGVYKYVGETTDAYENGALYVLEASVVKISLEVNSSDEGIFNFPVPSGATTWSDMNGVVDETSQYMITTAIAVDADVPKICRAGEIDLYFYGLVQNNINTDLVRVSDTLDYDNTYHSFVNTQSTGGGGSN